MASLIFNGHDTLNEYGLYVSQHTSFLPAIRRRNAEISGMDGFIEFGNEELLSRPLSVECVFSEPTGAQMKLRKLAYLFSKTGRIEFSDEPGLNYVGRIYDGAELTRMDYKGRAFVLDFECQPYLLGKTQTLTGGTNVKIEYGGTVRAPMRITIKNTGDTVISGISLQNIIIERT